MFNKYKHLANFVKINRVLDLPFVRFMACFFPKWQVFFMLKIYVKKQHSFIFL
ncbi:hypothetical protein J500_3440 [Acinetobacter sp. 479375]|nr:hypothetical protein J500_3440 [Acinetobacter sp. 479375]